MTRQELLSSIRPLLWDYASTATGLHGYGYHIRARSPAYGGGFYVYLVDPLFRLESLNQELYTTGDLARDAAQEHYNKQVLALFNITHFYYDFRMTQNYV